MKLIFTLILLFHSIVPIISQTQIKLQKEGGVYYIPCKVNGLEMKFVFDTGASDVSISLTELLYMLRNGHMDKNDIKGTEYYRIANGNIEEGVVINIRSMEIGGKILNNVNASVSKNLNAPLLLGNSALSQFGKFTFDYSKCYLFIGDSAELNLNHNVQKEISNKVNVDSNNLLINPIESKLRKWRKNNSSE